MFTHYDALQVREDASAEVIRAAYKALAQKWHPDKYVGTKEHAELRFKTIIAAYEVLASPELRALYDADLKTSRSEQANAERESTTLPNKGHQKESIPAQLWGGKMPIWKLFWLYMVGIPLAFISFEFSFARDNNRTLFASSTLILFYLVFIHACLWRSAKHSASRWSRRAAKGYCLAWALSPVWIGLIIGGTMGYEYMFGSSVLIEGTEYRQDSDEAYFAYQVEREHQRLAADQAESRERLARAALAERDESAAKVAKEQGIARFYRDFGLSQEEMSQPGITELIANRKRWAPYLDFRSPDFDQIAFNCLLRYESMKLGSAGTLESNINAAINRLSADREFTSQCIDASKPHVTEFDAAAERRDFDLALAKTYKKYPFLDSSKPKHNQPAIDAVLASTNDRVAKGYTRANAVIFAADKIAPKYQQ